MADYYTHIAEIITGTVEELDYLEKMFSASVEDGEPYNERDTILYALRNTPDRDPLLETVLRDVGYIYINSDGPNLEALAELLETFLRKFPTHAPIGVQWANTCSKPRADAYSGGAFYVTRYGTRWVSTNQWLMEQDHE